MTGKASKLNVTRRSFIKQCVVSGITIYTAPLALNSSLANAVSAHSKNQQQVDLSQYPQPKFRTDGIAKVTGQKIYGRDFRAMDMEGWPDQQAYGLILRSTKVDQVVTAINLDALPSDAQPFKVITSKELDEAGLAAPPFFGDDLLLPVGQAAAYYGHAVAILLFKNFEQFKQAKTKLQFGKAIQYGKTVKPVSRDPYAAWRIIRTEGLAGPSGEDAYSPMQDGLFFPTFQRRQTVWPGSPNQAGSVSERGLYHAQQLEKQLDEQDWLVVDQEYKSQSVDPMMMEPEAFNGYWDKADKTLHVVATSQSPHDFQEQIAEVIAHSKHKNGIKNIVVQSAFVGGGFGAKDHSIFPYYGAVASMLADGHPVYLAHDRFEQFQAGLKRHQFIMKNRLAFNKETGKIQALQSDMHSDGGGRANFSGTVAMVGASAIQGIYYLPRNDIQATAHQSNNVDAGSMRGYGTLQTMSAMEMMMNEAAAELKIDPIELRQRNTLKTGYRNTQGAIPHGELRYDDVLKKARQHEMWSEREKRKAEFEQKNPNYQFGTGFGIASKDFGTGAASPSSAISISADGEIEVGVVFMEMGTGTQTSQAVAIEPFVGKSADTVTVAKMEGWEAMQQFQTDNPYIISQSRQDEMAKNPQWTPVVAMASAASMSSYFQTHTTQAAANILFRYGLWPAAKELWGEGSRSVSFAGIDKCQWKNGELTYPGKPALPVKQLAAKAHEKGWVTSVMCHAFNRWEWAKADFTILGHKETYELDGLAVQYGSGAPDNRKNKMSSHDYHLINRQNMAYPATSLNNAMVTYYAPCATLVDVAVHKGSGKTKVVRSHTILDCGVPLINKLVEGQIEGGVAMGIGHALTEELPLGEKGPGDGTWNLNRYRVPLAKDVGVWQHSNELLEPLETESINKGIGEVVMIPVVPAIQEAVYQATGVRVRDLPITAKKLNKAKSA